MRPPTHPKHCLRGARRAAARAGMLAAAGALISLAGAGAAHAAPAPPGTGPTTTVTFKYTGAPQSWTVPAGVTSATFTAYGAGGDPYAGGGSAGGEATGTLQVQQGQVYQVTVGGAGTYSTAKSTGGGFNGGGNAGYNGDNEFSAGGGGGASDVRYDSSSSCAASLDCALADRIIVAAGGGGGSSYPAGGGAGGGLSGAAGTSIAGGATGGGGGGPAAGGVGGTGSSACESPSYDGTSGGLGTGGAGANDDADGVPGGGGGGGYYGGGGGGAGADDCNVSYLGAGGGGGSSYVTPSAAAGSTTTGGGAAALGNGWVTVSYATPVPGAPGGLTATAGDSQVTLSWAAPAYSGASQVTGYNIYQGTSSGGESSTPVNSSPVTGTSYTVTGLTDGTTYYFEVTAVNAEGEGPVSNEASATPAAPVAQQITFTSTPPSPAIYGGSYTPAATGGGSGNPVTFSIDPASTSGACSISGGTVSFTGAGTCTIDANQAGGNGYAAAPQVQQSFTIGQASQAITFTSAPPSPAVAGGTYTPAATGGGSGNPVTFSIDPASTPGACSISGGTVSFTGAGTCTIDANQAGDANYAAAPQVQQAITVDQTPAFVVDSPPATATAGQVYSYTFTASGTPGPSYALSGAPSWLSINASTGTVSGTVPAGTTSFSYSVTATNAVGTATAGPFTVTVTPASTKADLAAALSCPGTLAVGKTGTCTLTVTNRGPATATNVITAVALPASLAETSCSTGCAKYGNVVIWRQSSLAAGASAQATITVTATRSGRALVLGAAVSSSPDPAPLNNIALAIITISR